VAAGSGVSLAPACVANFAMPGVVYKKVRSQHWTSIDIGLKPDLDNPAVDAFTEHRARSILKEGRNLRPAPLGRKRLTRSTEMPIATLMVYFPTKTNPRLRSTSLEFSLESMNLAGFRPSQQKSARFRFRYAVYLRL
jgi:hypothetical protein